MAENKLQVGNIIEVHGWVMMKGLEGDCQYEVARIGKHLGIDVYWFSKPRGKKEIVGRYAYEVDSMINPSNNNRIEIIK